MIAHSQENIQPVLFIDPTIQPGQVTIRVLAEVTRPNVHPTQDIVEQFHRIDAILPKDTTPYKLRLKALINAGLELTTSLCLFGSKDLTISFGNRSYTRVTQAAIRQVEQYEDVANEDQERS